MSSILRSRPMTATSAPPSRLHLPASESAFTIIRTTLARYGSRAGRFLIVLVGNQQAGLGEHRLLDVDRHTDAQCDGHRVRRPRRHLDVAVEDQVRVESALLQVDDAHLFKRMT